MKNFDMAITLPAEGMGFSAHLTLHYLKNVNENVFSNFVNWVTYEKYHIEFNTYVKPYAIDLFGPGKNVPVVKVDVYPDLATLKKEASAIYESNTEYPWVPHITLKNIGKADIKIPGIIRVGPLKLKQL